MKKICTILLTLIMLLSLCACGNKDNASTDPSDMSQATTNSTENPTDGTQSTAEATQTPTDATDATGATTSAPTEDPTAAPTQPSVPETPTGCNHTWNNATCTTPKTCSKCGVTEGEPAEHIWNKATCTTPQTCSQCDTTKGKATGHSWKAATCTTPKTCSGCGATEGKATGHKWKSATCTAPKTCPDCGATEGSATGHSWSSWQDADLDRDPCTQDGNEYRTCSLCLAQEQRAVKAGHDFKDGYCARCDARDESYAFTYIDFTDKLFEAYIKQNLGIAAENKVAVEDMKKLTSFTIEKRVTDVAELKYATNLQSITILASGVSNLNALSGLPVKEVTLDSAEIDVTFMRNLKEVESVIFKGGILTGGTMQDIVSSPKLKQGVFYEIADIDFLSQAATVENLDLWGISSETDLSVLMALPKLNCVNLPDCLTEQQYAITDQLIISGVIVGIY